MLLLFLYTSSYLLLGRYYYTYARSYFLSLTLAQSQGRDKMYQPPATNQAPINHHVHSEIIYHRLLIQPPANSSSVSYLFSIAFIDH